MTSASDADDASPVPAAPPQRQAQRLRHMRRLAVGMLLLMVAVFIGAEMQVAAGRHPAWGYLASFAEAAMVGALADWFAVVALFRHPLGLPIWHTAIIPRSKDQIARNLGQFVESHFITVDTIVGRIRAFDPAAQAARWLTDEAHGRQAGRLVVSALRTLVPHVDDAAWRDALRDKLVNSLSAIDLAPVAAQLADELVAEQRHQQALDWVLERAIDWLESENALPTLAGILDAVDHVLISTFSGRIAGIVQRGFLKMAQAAVVEPDHPLRAQLDDLVARGQRHLQDNPEWHARLHRAQQGLLHSERLDAAVHRLWADLRQSLLDDLARPEPATGAAVARVLAQVGDSLGRDEAARAWLNDTLCDAVAPLVVRHRGKVAAFIQAQIDTWSKDEMTQRIELAIGRDLQFIRINGTLVGGLVGLVLHAVVGWLHGGG